ncbi:uncharacterized protein BJX67DRAFT_151939 [Aspergillus lucknowensis]|uniref:Mediator of RNA polymerase II transcription subunit 12 n=1 Tax=Aspergillus lucknowensis TaxID=176173 RepID=A0ABR4LNA2_9EURO
MIPHSSAGVQAWGHPLRALDNGLGHVDASQALSIPDFRSESLPTPVLSSHSGPPAVVDLTSSANDAPEREPPAKRLKVDASASSSAKHARLTPTTGGESRNTLGIANSKPFSLPWRGRPVWSFQTLVSEASGVSEDTEEDIISTSEGTRPSSPPRLPHLPWKSLSAEQLESNATKSRDPYPVKQVQTTPFRVEVPSDAPALKGDKVADFSPWTGNHPEDVLNDQSVKQGHYDRTQVSQNESNTARPSLYAQLKHRSGLQMLSSVFMAALEKRQNHIIVNAPSSFKPPPRVTLTDNKREAWLRDLANPSVPLRRLSRTIPHGIRGKALLDQCLNKWIPVGRAVWLAKCVGANEIRAFKRKGTSGSLAFGLETKWVREWTSGVQQFLEGVIGTCGSAEWKSKMTYALVSKGPILLGPPLTSDRASLTARLFFERLLDYDQYFTWFLSSLEGTSLNMLPVWLSMLGIYWDSLLRHRKRGRRLAELLLEKLFQITEIRRPTLLQPLIHRLSCCIRKLVLEHTSSLVLPDSWDIYRDLIWSCMNAKEHVDKATFNNLSERNARMQRPKYRPESTQQSEQQRAVQLFDSIKTSHDISSISVACLNEVEDKQALVAKLLEWSATPFRSGLRRVYTAARLLRKWKISGVDIEYYIISFLGAVPDTAQLNMGNIYHVISELARSQTFSISRYLQWLMAKGVAKMPSSKDDEALSGDLSLLPQLPMARLPEHVRNLRQTLLARTGMSVLEEGSAIQGLKSSIGQRLPNIFPDTTSKAILSDWSQFNLTWAVKSEVSMWVRQGVAKHVKDTARKIIGGPFSINSKASALTAEEFYYIREILEGFGDLSILADVLKQATECEDNVVLASASDSINYHFDALSVIGAASDLFRGLIESYARLKRFGTLSLDFVFSLIELGLRIPGEASTVTLLRQDLARIESKSALAAPSPLSDHIPATFTDVDASFRDKLDQLLSSGNGIDESAMTTVFNSLTKLIGGDIHTAKLSTSDPCRYLAYIRPFNPKYLDSMLVQWVCGLLRSSARPMLSRILPPLIGVGCITIHSFVLLVKKLLACENANPIGPKSTTLPLELLELLAPQDKIDADLVTYRFRLAQQEFLFKHPQETLDIINDAVTFFSSGFQDTSLLRVDLATCAAALLRTLLTQESSFVAEYCMRKLTVHSPFATVLEEAVDVLLGFHPEDELEPSSQAERVILMNNDFSLPFCRLKLQLLFNAKTGNKVKNDIVDVMFKAAVADSGSKRSHWIGLVNLMSQDAARQIRERAEASFFSVPLFDETSDVSSVPSAATSTSSLESAKLYLTIIEKLAYSIPEAGVQSVVPLIVERLDQLLQRLIITQANFNNFYENRNGMSSDPVVISQINFEQSLTFWFSALLRMTVLHRAAFDTFTPLGSKASSPQDQTRLLVSIFCISLAHLPDAIIHLSPTTNSFPQRFQHKNCQLCPEVLLQTHALDVAASLIDSFPDEARHQCARFLKEKCPPLLQSQNSHRFLYLLGPLSDSTAPNPQLPASVPSPAAGGSTPTPTPSGTFPGVLPGQAQSLTASTGFLPRLSENFSSVADRLRLQHRGRVIGPYQLRPWELLEDAAPIVGLNDTAVSLKLFDTRHIRA